MYNFSMYCNNKNIIFIEEDDQCNSCENYQRGVSCPLMEALGCGLVYLEGEMTVKNCGFYKKFSRSLKLVK